MNAQRSSVSHPKRKPTDYPSAPLSNQPKVFITPTPSSPISPFTKLLSIKYSRIDLPSPPANAGNRRSPQPRSPATPPPHSPPPHQFPPPIIILIQQQRMGKSRTQDRDSGNSKRSYARISLKRRKMLINMVIKEGFSIARAIKKLGLKLTTARFILQKYKESGTYPMKQFKKNTRMLRDLPDDASPALQVKVEEEQPKSGVKEEEECSEQREKEQGPTTLPEEPVFWYYYMPFPFS